MFYVGLPCVRWRCCGAPTAAVCVCMSVCLYVCVSVCVCGVRRAVSLCGSVLCVALLACWFYALPALCMAAMLYKYVQFCGSVRPPKPSPPPPPNPALLVPPSNYAPPPPFLSRCSLTPQRGLRVG